MAGMNSGIKVAPEDKISGAVQSYLQAKNNVGAMNIALEKEAIAKFESLIDVSMKGISGRFQNEAIDKKEKYLKEVTGVFTKTKGRPGAREMMEMKAGKDELEQFTAMYKDLRDVYSKSVQMAMGIKDPDSQKESMTKIGEIMEGDLTLKETWDKMSGLSWYVPGVEQVDPYKLRENALEVAGKAPTEYATKFDPFGNPIFETTTEADQKKLNSEIDRQWGQYSKQLQRKGFADLSEYGEFIGTGREVKFQRSKKTQPRGDGDGIDINFGGYSPEVTITDFTNSEPVVANQFKTQWDGAKNAQVPVPGTENAIPTAGAVGLSNKPVTLKSTGSSYDLNDGGKKFYKGYTAVANIFQITYAPTKNGELVLDLNERISKKDKKALAGVTFKPFIVGISKVNGEDHPGMWELNDENLQQLKMAYGKKLKGIDDIPKERPFRWEDASAATGKKSGYNYSNITLPK